MRRKFVRFWVDYWSSRAEFAHQRFLDSWTGMDMNDWEKAEQRARRKLERWRGRV